MLVLIRLVYKRILTGRNDELGTGMVPETELFAGWGTGVAAPME
jgi:hypothetical protein